MICLNSIIVIHARSIWPSLVGTSITFLFNSALYYFLYQPPPPHTPLKSYLHPWSSNNHNSGSRGYKDYSINVLFNIKINVCTHS